MPGIKTHCIQAAVTGAALYPFIGGVNAAAFSLSVVLIDLDHVVEYVRQTGSPKIWGVFPCCGIISKNLHRNFYVLNIFHTLEFLLLIGVLGLLHPIFFFILAGTLWHLALDLLMLAKHTLAFARALSLIEYIVRKGRPGTITRFHDLLQDNDVIIPVDRWNYPDWIRHWRRHRPLC